MVYKLASAGSKNSPVRKAASLGKITGRCTRYYDQYCREAIKYNYQKKVWLPTVSEVKKVIAHCNVKSICRLLRYTPQAYHKKTKYHLTKQVIIQLATFSIQAIGCQFTFMDILTK